MKIRWQTGKRELDTLMKIFGNMENTSFGDGLTEEELPTMAQSWEQKGYIVPAGGSYRLEEGLHLAVSTILNARSSFSCCRSISADTQKKELYFHGQTIILIEDEGTDELDLMWIPFLPLAIGALSDMFRTDNETDTVIFHMEGRSGGETDYDKTVRQQGGDFFVEADGQEQPQTKAEIVHDMTDWFSENHKKCLEEAVYFE